ncbi:MAG: PilZ domain-containing protein [Lachnospiraceae bacterium]|nr:PilZ domain-containing protein [Lachnospiraceae bacterium]
MRLDELQQEQKVTILASVGNEQLEFSSTVEDVNPQRHCVYLAPVLKNEKPVSFSGTPTHLLIYIDEQVPHIFRNVHITLVRRSKGEICYAVTASTTSVKYNRRRHFRCYIGIETTVMVGVHRAPYDAIIKDLSISGFGFTVDSDKECAIGDMVHFVLNERFPELMKNFSFNIYGIIVNRRELESGKTVCGCRITSNTAGIDAYIAMKERLRLQKERGNAVSPLT